MVLCDGVGIRYPSNGSVRNEFGGGGSLMSRGWYITCLFIGFTECVRRKYSDI